MQKGVFLEADVHERGLQAVFEVADLAFEDAAHEALLRGALDVEFLELAVFQHATRVSSVSALMMTSLWSFFSGRMSRLTFFTSVAAAARMVSTTPLGGSLNGTGS